MVRASFWVVLLTGLLCGGLVALFHYLRPPLLGQAIGAAVLLYCLVLLMAAWLGSQHELTDALFFLIPLAALQLLPDWLLVRELRVLAFPELGASRIGPVPVYMAGLMVAPLLVVVWLAEIAHRSSGWLGLATAALTSLVVFAAAEWAGVAFGLWLPRNVASWHGIAYYALAAEVLLGVATWLMFAQVQHRVFVLKIAGAAAVSAFYAGTLLASYVVFQRLL